MPFLAGNIYRENERAIVLKDLKDSKKVQN